MHGQHRRQQRRHRRRVRSHHQRRRRGLAVRPRDAALHAALPPARGAPDPLLHEQRDAPGDAGPRGGARRRGQRHVPPSDGRRGLRWELRARRLRGHRRLVEPRGHGGRGQRPRGGVPPHRRRARRLPPAVLRGDRRGSGRRRVASSAAQGDQRPGGGDLPQPGAPRRLHGVPRGGLQRPARRRPLQPHHVLPGPHAGALRRHRALGLRPAHRRDRLQRRHQHGPLRRLRRRAAARLPPPRPRRARPRRLHRRRRSAALRPAHSQPRGAAPERVHPGGAHRPHARRQRRQRRAGPRHARSGAADRRGGAAAPRRDVPHHGAAGARDQRDRGSGRRRGFPGARHDARGRHDRRALARQPRLRSALGPHARASAAGLAASGHGPGDRRRDVALAHEPPRAARLLLPGHERAGGHRQRRPAGSSRASTRR